MLKALIKIVLPVLLLSGCTGLFSIHKINIQQGNALTAEQLAGIQQGMSREALLEIAGEPILKPVFNQERWDYYYYLKKPDVEPEQKVVSVLFEGDQVSKIVR